MSARGETFGVGHLTSTENTGVFLNKSKIPKY